MLTVAQYEKIANNTTSSDIKPQFWLSFIGLRGTDSSSATPAANSTLGKLNANLKANGFEIGDGIDLQTVPMFEVAAHAGKDTIFPWGDNWNDYSAYTWCINDWSGSETYFGVGKKLPNDWGFYDVTANGWELTRDVSSDADLAQRVPADGVLPVSSGANASYCTLKSTGNEVKVDDARLWLHLSSRFTGWGKNSSNNRVTARLAFVPAN